MRSFLTWLAWRVYAVPQRIDWWKRDIVVAHGTVLRSGVKIGDHTRINHPSFLTACRIGRHYAIAGPLTVRSTNHDVHALALQAHTQKDLIRGKKANYGYARSSVSVGHNVWIGDSVILLDGTDVGHSSIVAAGSVVNRVFPPYSIIRDVPARLLKMRFTEKKVEILSKIDWWMWSIERLSIYQLLFVLNLHGISADRLLNSFKQVAT